MIEFAVIDKHGIQHKYPTLALAWKGCFVKDWVYYREAGTPFWKPVDEETEMYGEISAFEGKTEAELIAWQASVKAKTERGASAWD